MGTTSTTSVTTQVNIFSRRFKQECIFIQVSVVKTVISENDLHWVLLGLRHCQHVVSCTVGTIYEVGHHDSINM